MFGSGILEMAIGLIFFYFLLSTVCATINELISRVLDWRAKTLKLGIHKMLGGGGSGLMQEIYSHALITGQAQGKNGPSYISASTFSAALLDTLAQKAATVAAVAPALQDPVAPAEAVAPVPDAPHNWSTDDLRRAIGVAVPDEKTRQALLAVVASAGNDVAAARARLERWFDDSMDRVSGWYKRRSQLTVLVLAVLLTAVVNGDTLVLANSLWRDTVLRDSVTASARDAVNRAAAQGDGAAGAQRVAWSAAEIQKKVEEMNAPLGWAREDMARLRQGGYRLGEAARFFGAKLLGLLLTALAVSLGAPFWFDLLNRVSNLRSVGDRPERSDAA